MKKRSKKSNRVNSNGLYVLILILYPSLFTSRRPIIVIDF